MIVTTVTVNSTQGLEALTLTPWQGPSALHFGCPVQGSGLIRMDSIDSFWVVCSPAHLARLKSLAQRAIRQS